MKYCKYCKIKVDSPNDFCPLCFNHIEETDGKYEQFYTPRLKNETSDKKAFFISKLFFFLTICAISVCFIINYFVNFEVKWFLIVTFGILYVWILVAHTIMSRQTLFRKFFLQIIAIIALLYFTEQVSGSNTWLLQYVYPSISFTVLFVFTLILSINKNRTDNIVGFLFIILLLGIGSVLFIVLNLIDYKLLNFINAILCGLAFLGIVIFGTDAIKNYLSKKFHI